MATHPSILAWRITMDREAWQEAEGCNPWGHSESDTTERLSTHEKTIPTQEQTVTHEAYKRGRSR